MKRGQGRLVTDWELNRAIWAGKVELTRANERPVRCVRATCRQLVRAGEGRRLFLDGEPRGFLCRADQRGVQWGK